MLVTSYLQPHAKSIVCGDLNTLETVLFTQAITEQLDVESFRDKRVVLKGCGAQPIAPAAYAEATRLLMPVVKSLMYGEPCFSVPIFKKV